MINLKKLLLGSVTIVILGGCAAVKPTIQKSTFIVMKTPVFRYAYQGFIYKGDSVTKLEIYASGAAVMKLDISGSQVCSGTGLFSCMSKREFNRRYLSSSYPDDTFERVLRGEAIFGGKNLKRAKDGFTQKIDQDTVYAIEYSVLNNSIVFRDTLSNILIKVKDI